MLKNAFEILKPGGRFIGLTIDFNHMTLNNLQPVIDSEHLILSKDNLEEGVRMDYGGPNEPTIPIFFMP
jgi:hypothetical protein